MRRRPCSLSSRPERLVLTFPQLPLGPRLTLWAVAITCQWSFMRSGGGGDAPAGPGEVGTVGRRRSGRPRRLLRPCQCFARCSQAG